MCNHAFSFYILCTQQLAIINQKQSCDSKSLPILGLKWWESLSFSDLIKLYHTIFSLPLQLTKICRKGDVIAQLEQLK